MKSARDPIAAEWYLNNERVRRNLSPKLRPFVDVGNTGSEAINAELKLWFRGVFQIHGPILRLKLRIFQVAKLKAFVSAMYRKTTHQVKQQIVLLRPTKKWGVFDTTDEWNTRCGESNVEGVFPKSIYMRSRDVYSQRLSEWKKKNDVKTQNSKKVKRAPREHRVGSRRGRALDGMADFKRRACE